jgi:hypothetical protein
MTPPPANTAAVTESAVVKAAPGELIAAILAAAAADATLTIYDNATTTAGTVLASLAAKAGTSVQWSPAASQRAAAGIYAAIAGEGATASVAYY